MPEPVEAEPVPVLPEPADRKPVPVLTKTTKTS
ncbi:hypothetical protein STAFG_0119 [Streptomyces afghaniensis 772]|uniref:Uncharacterized protein n=1 Tax=Streptomyces afghaniensis 772 TaxID=1283301 RepID=S4N1V2_9ACTN|nr:hypothetical protein STAFG_0119 [Streptomyces afghaniensis 772]